MFKRFYHKWCSEIDRYFATAPGEIAALNLLTLMQVSLICTGLVLLFLLLTPLFFPGWRPTAQHLLFAPASAAFFGLAWGYRRTRRPTPAIVNLLCLAFIACAFLFVIFIDTFQSPNAPSSFMPVILIVLPTLFVLRLSLLYLELGVFELFYLLCLFQQKTPEIARSDCFNSLVGLAISVAMAAIFQNLRAETANTKNRYRRLSQLDGLTGIRNKTSCEQAACAYLARRPAGEACALLVLDVDDFKSINDTLGHLAGDDLLESLGATLLHTFYSGDIVGRIGGDEFLVLMCGLPAEASPAHKCHALREAIRALCFRPGQHFTVSMGVALLPAGVATTYEELFRTADNALYEAKGRGKDRCVVRTCRPLPLPG